MCVVYQEIRCFSIFVEYVDKHVRYLAKDLNTKPHTFPFDEVGGEDYYHYGDDC